MTSTRSPFEPGKTIHKINPLGMRVVVKIPKNQNRSEGGLFLPEGAKEATEESLLAEVIEVATAHDSETDENENISGIPLHSWVLINKTSGIKVPWNDTLRIVDTEDVLALVEPIDLV